MAGLVAFGLLAAASLASVAAAQSRLTININPAWRFHLGDPGGTPYGTEYDDATWDTISLPHSHELFSANLQGFQERGRTVGWYRRQLQVPADWKGKKLFLEFQGAMQATTLWINGQRAGEYAVSGYDSFDFDISPYVKEGKNLLAVQVDNRPNGELPPDGEKTDYILFGGLYRDVFLHVTDTMHLTFPWEKRQAGVRLTLPEVSEAGAVVQAESTVRNESGQPRTCTLVTEIRDREGKTVATMKKEKEIPAGAEATFNQRSDQIAKPHLWSPDDPYLYRVRTLVFEGNREVDRLETPLGLRWVKFDKQNGFFLNGHHLKLVGANCHQTWPFIGGAVPDSLHRRDAEQLKAMGVNWVRLSHYPQSPQFLDALDELGLMALEEPPTWMNSHPGKWLANLEASFRSMIRRDRNHPCIIVWAACINHYGADPALVRAAIEEDPTRDRGQDTVPLPMDFGRLQSSGGGALAIEHTGHTFPAQRGARAMTRRVMGGERGKLEVSINREYEQAQRHWEQVNAADLREANAGLAVWCMYDYNTFHNTTEPGMVWHGVICSGFPSTATGGTSPS
ncbi:Glycoside hydrolase family 2 (fragment) [Verrucomicrobia bacterium]